MPKFSYENWGLVAAFGPWHFAELDYSFDKALDRYSFGSGGMGDYSTTRSTAFFPWEGGKPSIESIIVMPSQTWQNTSKGFKLLAGDNVSAWVYLTGETCGHVVQQGGPIKSSKGPSLYGGWSIALAERHGQEVIMAAVDAIYGFVDMWWVELGFNGTLLLKSSLKRKLASAKVVPALAVVGPPINRFEARLFRLIVDSLERS